MSFSERQKELFTDIKKLKYLIDSVAAWVQNDYVKLLKDRYTTLQEIEDSKEKIESSCQLMYIELEKRKKQTFDFIDDFIKYKKDSNYEK